MAWSPQLIDLTRPMTRETIIGKIISEDSPYKRGPAEPVRGAVRQRRLQQGHATEALEARQNVLSQNIYIIEGLGAPDRAVGRRVHFAAFPVAGAGGSSGNPPPATKAGGGLVRLNGRQPLMEER